MPFGVVLKISDQAFAESRPRASVHFHEQGFGRRTLQDRGGCSHLPGVYEGKKVRWAGPEAKGLREPQKEDNRKICEIAFQGIQSKDRGLAPVKKALVFSAFADRPEEDFPHEHRNGGLGQAVPYSGEQVPVGEFPGPPKIGLGVQGHFAVKKAHRTEHPRRRLPPHRYQKAPSPP